MDKFLIILERIKLIILAFWAWVRLRPRNVLISAASFLLVIVGLVLFIEFVLPTLLTIGFLIVAFYNLPGKTPPTSEPQQTLTLADDSVCWEITQFMFDVISSISGVLSEFTHMPVTPNDLYDDATYRGHINAAPMLKLRVHRNQKDISQDDCDYLKNALQGAVNARIRDGYLAGLLWAFPASYLPLVKIASVECSAAYLHMDILLTNTGASVQAARLSDRQNLLPSGDSSDPLFRR